MTLAFYPHPDDSGKGTMHERLEVLMEAAERYKALIMDAANQKAEGGSRKLVKGARPKEISAAFNWDEISEVLKEVRSMPEGDPKEKEKKAKMLNTLAEVYEILRAAKMPKLEAVRLALANESSQLVGGGGAEVG